MVPVHNYSMSPDSLLVDGIDSHRLRHHHGHKALSKNISATTADTCYCVPFM